MATPKEKTSLIRFPGSPTQEPERIVVDEKTTVRDILLGSKSVKVGEHALSIRDPETGKPRVLQEDEKVFPLITKPDQEILATELEHVALA